MSINNAPAKTDEGLGDSVIVGKFGIVKDSNNSYQYTTTDLEIPKIINIPELRAACNSKMQLDISSAASEYHEFHDKKQEFFFSTFLQEYYKQEKQRNSTFKLPKFICFGSRIAYALASPYDNLSRWDFYAVKHHQGTVFLWIDSKKYEEPASQKKGVKFSRMGETFEAFMTGHRSQNTLLDLTNRKPLVVHEKRFRNHSLLLLSDIDARDENDQWVEIKLNRQQTQQRHFGSVPISIDGNGHPVNKSKLRLWSQCEVSGCTRIIIGERNNHGQLVGFEDFSLEMVDFGMVELRKKICYDFLDRLLTSIDDQLFIPGCTKFFRYPASLSEDGQFRNEVECVDVTKEVQVPEWLSSTFEIMNCN